MKTSRLEMRAKSVRDEFYESNERDQLEEQSITNDILAINWKPVYRINAKPHSSTSPHDVIANIVVKKKTKTNNATKQLSFRIGKEVAKKMGVQDGDYLALFYDENNPQKMMIVKNEKGYVCRDENFNGVQSNFMRVNFRADWLLTNQSFKGVHAKYVIDQRRLILTLTL